MACMTCRMIVLLDSISTHVPGLALTVMEILFGDVPVVGWALSLIGMYILMKEISLAMNNVFYLDDISDPLQMERFTYELIRLLFLFSFGGALLTVLAPVMSVDMFVSLVLVGTLSILTHSSTPLENYAVEAIIEALLRGGIFKGE